MCTPRMKTHGDLLHPHRRLQVGHGCRPADLHAAGCPPQRSFQRQMEGLERLMAMAYTSGHNVVILLDDAQLMEAKRSR